MTPTSEVRARECNNCIHWVQGAASDATTPEVIDSLADVGTCHLQPPVPILSITGVQWNYPLTHASRFCADHFEPSDLDDDDDDPPGDEIPVIKTKPILRAVSTVPAAA